MKKTSTEYDRMKAALKAKKNATFGRALAYAPGPNQGGEVYDAAGAGDADTVPTVLAHGEYVLPADTVEQVGVENLEQLKNATHEPLKNGGKVKFGCADGGVIQAIRNRPRRIDVAEQAAVNNSPPPPEPPIKTIEQQTKEKVLQPAQDLLNKGKEGVEKVKKFFGMAEGGLISGRAKRINDAVDAAVAPAPAPKPAPTPAPAQPQLGLDAQVAAQQAAARAKLAEEAKYNGVFGRARKALGFADGGWVYQNGRISGDQSNAAYARMQATELAEQQARQMGLPPSPTPTANAAPVTANAAAFTANAAPVTANAAPVTANAAPMQFGASSQAYTDQFNRSIGSRIRGSDLVGSFTRSASFGSPYGVGMADGGETLEERLKAAAAPYLDAARGVVKQVLPRPPGGETPEDQAALDRAIAEDNPFDVAAVPVVGFGASIPAAASKTASTVAAAPAAAVDAVKSMASKIASKRAPAAAPAAAPAEAAATKAAAVKVGDDGIPILDDAVSGVGVPRTPAPLNPRQIAERRAAAQAAQTPAAPVLTGPVGVKPPLAGTAPHAGKVMVAGAAGAPIKFGAANAAAPAAGGSVDPNGTKMGPPEPEPTYGGINTPVLRSMGISDEDLARPAVPDAMRGEIVRNARPDPGVNVHLGDYGGDGQAIFGSASKPGGRIDTFTGAGGGTNKATGYAPKGVDFGIKPGEVERYKQQLEDYSQLGAAPDAQRNPVAYAAYQRAANERAATRGATQVGMAKAHADYTKAVIDGNVEMAKAAAAKVETAYKRSLDNAKTWDDIAKDVGTVGIPGVSATPEEQTAALGVVFKTIQSKTGSGFAELNPQLKEKYLSMATAMVKQYYASGGLFSIQPSLGVASRAQPMQFGDYLQAIWSNPGIASPFSPRGYKTETGQYVQYTDRELAALRGFGLVKD